VPDVGHDDTTRDATLRLSGRRQGHPPSAATNMVIKRTIAATNMA
jgi:hypothetical protein